MKTTKTEWFPLWAVTAVWNYVAELIFNLLVLVGSIKMSDRIVKEIFGL